MELRQTIESIRDITVDVFQAGKIAVAEWIAGKEAEVCDAINDPTDEYWIERGEN